jgi:DNA-binding transcriptional MerR regulator
MRARLTIGEFATLTHLSVRTLRRYHEAGLLEPASVDAATGYRYYTAEQIPPAQVIHRLRQLDVPLAEVKAILATDDPRRRADLVTAHLRRLEENLDRTKAAVVSLRQLLQPADTVQFSVRLRSLPRRNRPTAASPSSRRELPGEPSA